MSATQTAEKSTSARGARAPKNTFTAAAEPPADKPAAADSKPQRFVHEDAFAVMILTPNDAEFSAECKRALADEFSFLEEPPQLIRELPAQQMYPGIVLYVAHPMKQRERDARTGRFADVRRVHVSEPVFLKDYFALSRKNGGLDLKQLHIKLNSLLNNNPRGFFWLFRKTNDGGLKMFDT